MVNAIIILVSIVIFLFYIVDIKKNKIDTKTMVMVGMTCAVSYILYMIPLIKYPQGGGITLLSMMPVMILSILCGKSAGLTGGLIFGLLKLLNGSMILHPAQFLLDFILGNMALGLAGTFGSDKKCKIIYGCILAVILSVGSSIVSGVLFFGQFAPEGVPTIVHSLLYNISSSGVEGIVATIVIVILPLNRFNRVVNKADLFYS